MTPSISSNLNTAIRHCLRRNGSDFSGHGKIADDTKTGYVIKNFFRYNLALGVTRGMYNILIHLVYSEKNCIHGEIARALMMGILKSQ